MGCISIKSHKGIGISVSSPRKSSKENSGNLRPEGENASLFIIREESAHYEESAVPSRLQSHHQISK